ncbi:hypothetical protein SDC9_192401 [bioreactor metagenome]|uniref:Uncharacterized protein n=1 Tax=bioreactor metagenome TaxID=1076179 RepID=A0A645I944_9ZZZZ
MSNCSHQAVILNNGAAAHPLNNTASQAEQTRVGNPDDHIFAVLAQGIYFRYFYIESLNVFTVDNRHYLRFTGFNLMGIGNFQVKLFERIFYFLVQLSKYSKG